jgi:hypothetical protein
MGIAQPSILSLCTFRNHDYDFQREMIVANPEGSRARPPGSHRQRAIVLEKSLGALRSCPKYMLKVAVFIVLFLFPSRQRIG